MQTDLELGKIADYPNIHPKLETLMGKKITIVKNIRSIFKSEN